jgi:ribosomal protein S18 acetylase RimI-like enzyme
MNDELTIKKERIKAYGIKFSVLQNNKSVARLYLYIVNNDLHNKPFGLIEDVFVKSGQREKGLGSKLLKEAIKEAKDIGCYKIICTSRYSNRIAHNFYKKLGFKDHGKEYRMDLKK